MLLTPLTLLPSFLTQIDSSAPIAQTYEHQVKELLKQNPSTLVVLQTDMGVFPDGVNFVVPPEGMYSAGEQVVAADMELARQIQVSLEEHERKSHINENAELLTTLSYLLELVSKHSGEKMPRIVVIGTSLQSAEEHYKLGSLMKRAIDSDTEAVAVVALGTLSSQLDKDSVFGYSRFGKEFNAEYLKYLTSGKVENFLYIDPFIIDEVAETIYKSTAMLLGVVNGLDEKPNVEVEDFEVGGVGYVVGRIGV